MSKTMFMFNFPNSLKNLNTAASCVRTYNRLYSIYRIDNVKSE